MKLLIFSLCLIIAWLAGTWAHVFSLVIAEGQVVIVESNPVILQAEYILLASLAVAAIGGVILTLLMKFEEE